MVGTCVGTGAWRPARVAWRLCPVCWRWPFLRRSDSELRFREDQSQGSLPMPERLSLRHPATSAQRPGLRVYGHLWDTVFRLSGIGTADGSTACHPVEGCYRIGRGMAAAAGVPARLDVLSCRRFHSCWSVDVGHRICRQAAKSTRRGAFRLKSRPALITEGR
jgi:hypothetical protein